MSLGGGSFFWVTVQLTKGTAVDRMGDRMGLADGNLVDASVGGCVIFVSFPPGCLNVDSSQTTSLLLEKSCGQRSVDEPDCRLSWGRILFTFGFSGQRW